ncbi:hypothetical protein ALC57_01893, partial [Trachymyrmex cornetzi]
FFTCFLLVEPKKRRFHPLRGLRKIFRRKSRGAADARSVSNSADRDTELARIPREEITMRHPAGRPEEARSRSASELLTDSCDRESVFLRRSGVEDSFVKLRGGAGKLSVSHDSVFPGEVPHTRPLSSLASLATLERRQARKSNEIIEHKEYNHHHVVQRHRISLRVLEQIKTVIENRNQLASATSPDTASIAHKFIAQNPEILITISKNTNIPRIEFLKAISLIFNYTYFKFDELFFKQIFGMPMGSPLSPILSIIDMLRDDIILAALTNQINDILHVFNACHDRLKFTCQENIDGSINFLDVSLKIENEHIIFDIFKKPTNSGRYLNFNSNHLDYSLQDSNDIDLIKNYFIIPYIKKVSEKFKSIAKRNNFTVAFKPINILNSIIKTDKDKLKTMEQNSVIYKINCLDCSSSVGQTKRKIKTRIAEHKRSSSNANNAHL